MMLIWTVLEPVLTSRTFYQHSKHWSKLLQQEKVNTYEDELHLKYGTDFEILNFIIIKSMLLYLYVLCGDLADDKVSRWACLYVRYHTFCSVVYHCISGSQLMPMLRYCDAGWSVVS